MLIRRASIIRLLLLSGGMILLALQPVFATSEVTGAFTGKVMCQAGVKKAEFKDPHTLALSYSTSATIKRRIDAVSWPSSGNTESFTERENEKVSLQKALKLLKNLSCDDNPPSAPDTGTTPQDMERGHGPQLNPEPEATPLMSH